MHSVDVHWNSLPADEKVVSVVCFLKDSCPEIVVIGALKFSEVCDLY